MGLRVTVEVPCRDTECLWCHVPLPRGEVCYGLALAELGTASVTLHCAECVQPELDRKREVALLDDKAREKAAAEDRRKARERRMAMMKAGMTRGAAAGRLRRPAAE